MSFWLLNAKSFYNMQYINTLFFLGLFVHKYISCNEEDTAFIEGQQYFYTVYYFCTLLIVFLSKILHACFVFVFVVGPSSNWLLYFIYISLIYKVCNAFFQCVMYCMHLMYSFVE